MKNFVAPKKTIDTKVLLEKFDALVTAVRDYAVAVKKVQVKTAGIYFAYGKTGEKNDPAKSGPNMLLIKDLISQVQTAAMLGYTTRLTVADNDELLVEFVGKAPSLPLDMQYL
jgi:hypothetical protein